MAMVRFRAQIATDPHTGLPRPELVGASGQVVLEGTTTPAPIWEDQAQTVLIGGSSLVVSAQMFVPQFFTDGVYEVDWWDGQNRVPLDSNAGARDAAIVAASAAQAAQGAAQTASFAAAAAAAAAQDAANEAGAGAGGGAGNGNILAIKWDGVGTQPERVYPSWHPLAGQDIPDPPEVIVRWRQPTKPLGVAKDDDEYRRMG